jgi:osmoprotectant transport system permease protein
VPLILEGAVPAAVLALAVEGAFGLLERAVVSRGLRPGDTAAHGLRAT